MDRDTGKVVKGVGGLYTVRTPSGTYEARGRGIFRKDGIRILIGDNVELSPDDENSGFVITAVKPRKNRLIRPAAANIDNIFLVISASNPKPDLLLLDRILAVSEEKGILTHLVINKMDQDPAEASRLFEEYRCAVRGGVFVTALAGGGSGEGTGKTADSGNGEGAAETASEIRRMIPPGVTVLAGQSGVGKSTLTNLILDRSAMDTGDLSRKLSRGRHTTRHSELFEISGDRYIIDSPGFSLFDAMEDVTAAELKTLCPELAEVSGCRFPDCSHTGEPGCMAAPLVAEGRMSPGRYDRYKALYRELKEKERNKYR